MKVSTALAFIRSHHGPRKAPGILTRSDKELYPFINAGVAAAAKLLIQQREPQMLTEWRFDVTSGKQAYALYNDIAPGTAPLSDDVNFGRLHSLYIKNRDGTRWDPWRIIDKQTAIQRSSLDAVDPNYVAYSEVRPGHGGAGGTEGDFSVILENPPNWSTVQGGRLSVFFVPRPLADTDVVGYEIALPPLADEYALFFALRRLYLADGAVAMYDKARQELLDLELNLRAAGGSGLSDDPTFMEDMRGEEAGSRQIGS